MRLGGKIAVAIAVLMLFSNISIAVKPDIYVENVSIAQHKIYEGDEVRINFTVGNNGDVAVNFQVALFVDDRNKVIDTINVSLNAGEKKQESLFWLAREGNHTLFIYADYDNAINEENEDNNIVSIDVTVLKPKYLAFPPPPANATWWDARWHYRVPLATSMFGNRIGYLFQNKMVYCNINFTHLMDVISHNQTGTFSKRTFYPDSVRIIEYEYDNGTWHPLRSVGREMIFPKNYDPVKNANVTLIWVMEGNLKPHERRYYYVYWDTVENGRKSGEYGKIYAGIKNCEFEAKGQWSNYTSGAMKWTLGYVDDPLEKDKCYRFHASGLYGFGRIWVNGYYAKLSQSFNVPDEGQNNYIFHGRVYVSSDIDIFHWEISIDGKSIASGKVNSGWEEISKNITSYLQGKTSAVIAFTIEVAQTQIYKEAHELNAYIDSFWIETENVDSSIYEKHAGGWDGTIDVEKEYIAGVKGRNSMDLIDVSTLAQPREIVAKLISPRAKVVKASMPFPDPSFEYDYTSTFVSDVKTGEAKIVTGVSHSGNKAVELKLSNYVGKFKIENEDVKASDVAGMRQNITYRLPLLYIPTISFWYKIEKATPASYLNYTLLTIGSSPLHHKIYLSSLISDGDWHLYTIPPSIITKWRSHGGKVAGCEIRLVAGEEKAEDTVYIDDLGYSFMPVEDRTKWEIKDFYNFTNGENYGEWRLDIIMEDASDYRITKSVFIKVFPSADLDVYKVDFPSGLKEGEKGKFTVYIKNNGPKSINESTPINVTLIIYQDALKPIKMKKSIAGLSKGEKKKVYFEWEAIYGDAKFNGTWNVVAKVNEENSIAEWNTMNNWYATKIKVEPRPNMEIEMDDVSFSPSHPSFGQRVNITVIVHNIGYKEGVAKVNIYEKEKGERRYRIISNNSMEKLIAGRSWEKLVINWLPTANGTFNIKIGVECNDEIDTSDNTVIKDIRVGGAIDGNPPSITNIRATPAEQSIGEYVNISATIFDNETTIDKAVVYVGNLSNETEYVMKRLGESNVYYSTVSFNKIGEYYFYIEAWDTANIQNYRESTKGKIRIIYAGIETNPPTIKGITFPEREVVNKYVNISAYIDDESGLESVNLHIIHNGVEKIHEMSAKNGSKIYYYESKYNVGTYEFYIEAIDASANRNKNVSATYSFEIPVDYDGDDVPDRIEIEIGGNPENASDVVNVTVGEHFGYLIFTGEKYIYWNKNRNTTSDTETRDVNKDGYLDILFDVDGDGNYDHYYDRKAKEIGLIKEEETHKSDIIWIAPPAVLFLAVGILFVALRKK